MNSITAAKSLKLDAIDITLNLGVAVQAGKLAIKTDESARMLPQRYKNRDGRPPSSVDSLCSVVFDKNQAVKYAEKIVIIGGIAVGVAALLQTPAGPSFSIAARTAHPISSMVSEHLMVQPVWGVWVTFGVLCLVATYLMASLPRVSAGQAAVATLLVVWLLVGFSFLSAAAKRLHGIFPAALRVIGSLALTTQRFLITGAGKLKTDEESAETAERLQHQHRVTIFDVGGAPGLDYMAMAFLRGKELTDVTKSGQLLPVANVLPIAEWVAERLAEVLACAHKPSVAHRDSKRLTIMFDAERASVNATAVGIARIPDSGQTTMGGVPSAPGFMSPEQITDKKVDGGLAPYGLSVMLSQRQAGELPFWGDPMVALMDRVGNKPASDSRTIGGALSGKLAENVARALVKRSEMRDQSGDQFASDLKAVKAGLTSGLARDLGATGSHMETGVIAALQANHQATEKAVAVTSRRTKKSHSTEAVITQFSNAAKNTSSANYDVNQATSVDQLPACVTTLVTCPDVAGLPSEDGDTDPKLQRSSR